MVGSYKHPGWGMGRGEGYRPQMVLEIMLETGEPMTSEEIRLHTNCTDRRHFGSLLSRMSVSYTHLTLPTNREV